MDEFKGLLNLVLLIVFVAASVLGPVVERWRRRKEMERRAQRPPPASPEGEAEVEAEVGEAPPPSTGPKLPYEEVLHELFGPYVERRRREAEEARRQAEADVEAEAEAIEVVEEPPPRAPEPVKPSGPRFVHADTSAPAEPRFVHVETTVPLLPRASAGNPGVHRSLDVIVFRNPRLSPGAKLLLASEILGKPRAFRGK